MDEKVKQIYESVKAKYEQEYDPSYECSFSDYVYISSLTDQYLATTGLTIEDVEWTTGAGIYTVQHDPITYTYGISSVAGVVADVKTPNGATTYVVGADGGRGIVVNPNDITTISTNIPLTTTHTITNAGSTGPYTSSTTNAYIPDTTSQHYQRMQEFVGQLRQTLGVEGRVDWEDQIMEWAQDYASAVKRDAEQAERKARQQDWIQELYKVAEINAQIRAAAKADEGDKHDEAYTNAMKLL